MAVADRPITRSKSQFLFKVLKYDGDGNLSEEIRIYEPVGKGYQIPRLEILHGVVKISAENKQTR